MSQPTTLLLITFVVAMLALFLACLGLFIAFTTLRGRASSSLAERTARTVKDGTEVVRRRSLPEHQPRAWLVPLLDNAGTLGEPIPIKSQSVTLGRAPQYAQIVLSDNSVSRLHARIVEEVGGVFRLIDEGSSSGTLLDEEPVSVGLGRYLKSGDVIALGRMRLVFRVDEDAHAPNSATAVHETLLTDETEPLSPALSRRLR